jgi:hypothetical protein
MKETILEKVLNKLQYVVLELNNHKGGYLDFDVGDKMLDLIEECKQLLIK